MPKAMNKWCRNSPRALITAFTISAVIFMAACGVKVFAEESDGLRNTGTEPLMLNEVWLTGDILHISVTDKNTGVDQTLKLNLSDYADKSDELVTVQAIDRDGNNSNMIQFKNPYYKPEEETTDKSESDGIDDSNDKREIDTADTPDNSESAITEDLNAHEGTKPFTPDGTGTVEDNVTGNDGKEFFSITTDDGNVFYLIVDRQRANDNVYLLNAVTEDDLASLAKSGYGKSGGSASVIPTTEPTATPMRETPNTSAPEEPIKPVAQVSNNSLIIFIAIVLAAVGGAGYYFKIVRPKINAVNADDSDDYEDEPEESDGDDFDDEEIEVSDDNDGGGEE